MPRRTVITTGIAAVDMCFFNRKKTLALTRVLRSWTTRGRTKRQEFPRLHTEKFARCISPQSTLAFHIPAWRRWCKRLGLEASVHSAEGVEESQLMPMDSRDMGKAPDVVQETYKATSRSHGRSLFYPHQLFSTAISDYRSTGRFYEVDSLCSRQE